MVAEEIKEDISLDFGKIALKIWIWSKANYLLFLILIPILLSIHIRIQPVYLPALDNAAEANIRSSIQQSITDQVNVQYPNLPEENKQKIIQQQLDALYAAGTIDYLGQQIPIEQLVEENAKQLKAQFQDEYGLTYLGEIDPWYFYRLTENYLEHGYEGDVEINGIYYDTHQMAGTPREVLGGETSKLPHFHVMVEVYLYKIISFLVPNIRLMTVVYFLPVLLAALAVIPAFFLVKKVAGNMGAVVAATIVAVHPAFVGRTIAGFSDTDGYNILFPLVIMWIFVEALEAQNLKKALGLGIFGGIIVGIFSYTWGGWWYIYDFLLGVCFIILWYLFVKKQIAGKNRNQKVAWVAGAMILAPLFVLGAALRSLLAVIRKKEIEEEQKTLCAILIFQIFCGIFVTLFSSFKIFINAVKEPLTFSAIKEVGVIKIWPNVLTTVAEFNPASLSEIIGTVSFGQGILLLLALLGVGYALFERAIIAKEQEWMLAGGLVWVIGLALVSSKITSPFLFTILLFAPLGYLIYKNVSFATMYFVGVSMWYAAITKLISHLDGTLFFFFFLLGIPLAVGVVYALLEEQKADMKYAILLFIWFVGTIYASTQGVRFVMILVPAFAVACGFGVSFVYRIWIDVIADVIKIQVKWVKTVLIAGVAILLFIPVGIGYSLGSQQMPLINDGWYNALVKINQQAAPDAIVNSWWDFGHWFKAIADRAVTFDGGSQDTPQAHWIGRVLLTDNESEAIGILRMLDCGGGTAYDTLYKKLNNSYKTITLTKEIILLSEEDARTRLTENGFSEEETSMVLLYTHCTPPENYFITSQDMVGKSGVWAHFGSWNFERAYIVNVANSYEKEKALAIIEEDIGFSPEEAERLYQEAITSDPNNWITGWPAYVSMPQGCWQEKEMLFCSSGVVVNLTTGDAGVMTSEGNKHPQKLLYIAPDGSFNTTDFRNATDVLISSDGRSSYSAGIIPSGTSFTGFFMDSQLLESMFTKLFFYKGHGLECFDLFEEQHTVTGETIYVWKVDWSCSSANEVFVQQEAVASAESPVETIEIETAEENQSIT